LLQDVGNGFDYPLANLLHADVPDGSGRVSHLPSAIKTKTKRIQNEKCEAPAPITAAAFTVCLSLLLSREARFCTQLCTVIRTPEQGVSQKADCCI
jgi:hypothetical protein